MIDYDWQGYQDIIEKTTLHLFERFIKNGLSGIAYYCEFFTLWIVFELISELSKQSISDKLKSKMDQAVIVLSNRLEKETKRYFLTPQNVALLTLTCLNQSNSSLFNPKWITTLLKTQRYDGSWDDEPLFPAPSHGVIGFWYSSRLMTTAFCYHALKTYAKSELS